MYCTHALQYECQSVRININGSPSFLPTARNVPRLPDCVLAPHKVERVSENKLQTSWRDVLRLYTQRALTKSKDRLVAFSAIAEQFHELWPQSSYLAGLWRHQLPQALLWEPGKNRQHPRPSEYRGPSWSWAAMDGEVKAFCGSSEGCLCTITDLQVDLKNPKHPFGEVTGGFLVLSAIIRMVAWDVDEMELFERDSSNRALVLSSNEHSENGEIGYVMADAVEVSGTMGDIFVAVIKDTGPALHGLVLAPANDDTCDLDTYRRVGWFTAPFCDRGAWLSTDARTIRII
ncbi:hypothetical protein GGX14DRAFT_381852 [Mycena pura]|uniref:Heterokaryon incompatibility domain-containing protein n=1 Tax=Mycena pura TaxID=153505 RepID=A0AAD6Y080_9AGAR|nr:hypothetical protein GGX14DRAFT_381852 [Mycena pura]